jgi:H+/Cl- antiporter ClcA
LLRAFPSPFRRALLIARVDFTPLHRRPNAVRVVAALIIAVAGALAADAILVAIGTHAFPSTVGNEHFRFADYAKLTVIGVVIGAVGWSVITSINSAPRWLYGPIRVIASAASGSDRR